MTSPTLIISTPERAAEIIEKYPSVIPDEYFRKLEDIRTAKGGIVEIPGEEIRRWSRELEGLEGRISSFGKTDPLSPTLTRGAVSWKNHQTIFINYC